MGEVKLNRQALQISNHIKIHFDPELIKANKQVIAARYTKLAGECGYESPQTW